MECRCIVESSASLLENIGVLVAMVAGLSAILFGLWQQRAVRNQLAQNAAQLKLLSQQTQMSISDTLMARLQSINEILISLPNVDEALEDGLDSIPADVRRAASRVLNLRLNLYDIVYWSFEKGWIDMLEYAAWKRTIARNLKGRLARDHWGETKDQYERGFQDFLDGLIRE
jgi:hypothetical protein